MNTGLNGKVAVVTGAAGAFGAAVCARLAQCGARVAACDPNGATGFSLSLSRRGEIDAEVGRIADAFGGVDLLVQCEEIERSERVRLDEIDFERYERAMDAGVKGLFTLAKRCAREMAKRGGGSIVLVTSIFGVTPAAKRDAEVAVAGATVGLAKMWGVELKGERIRVNAVAAGFREGDALPAHLAIPRAVRAKDVAAAACFLASDDASYITGAVLPVDGGLSAGYVRSF